MNTTQSVSAAQVVSDYQSTAEISDNQLEEIVAAAEGESMEMREKVSHNNTVSVYALCLLQANSYYLVMCDIPFVLLLGWSLGGELLLFA